MLEVLAPGLLSTIQDAGRPAAAPLGVPRGGACDPLACRVLQELVDAPRPTTAVLEVTLLGPELAVRETCVIGLAGADLAAQVVEEGRTLAPGTTALVRAGTTIRFGEARDGCRAYLSLAGGIDVPLVLDSRSTCLVGGFGGLDGRPLRAGDALRPVDPDRLDLAGGTWPGPAGGTAEAAGPRSVRVVPGPHADRFPPGALARLAGTDWDVSLRSDRMGLRLTGPPVPEASSPELVSLPVTWGAVQVPPGGEPIVLLADHQTVGGYPALAVVASVDRPIVGQLRPMDRVRFEPMTVGQAHGLRLRAEAEFAARRQAFSRR